MNPAPFAGSGIAVAAHRAGFDGCLNLEHVDSVAACAAITSLSSARVEFSIQISRHDESILASLYNACSHGLRRVILAQATNSDAQSDVKCNVDRIRAVGIEVFAQVINEEQAVSAAQAGADAIVIKGSEGGGIIGEETSLVLLQRVIRAVQIPVWVRGGIGLHSAAACLAGGAAGVVLDWQLALCSESELPAEIKARITRMDGSETAVLGQGCGDRYRAYFRPGERAFAELREIEDQLAMSDASEDTITKQWREQVEARISQSDETRRLLILGQDAVFAASLEERFRSVGQVCTAIRDSASRHCRSAARNSALRPGGPLAESHGTRYPIVQGPMTRVSDTADFALSVAEGGGLPFLALALLRGPQVGALLEETKRKLGSRPWGVGILGFVPKELREEQLAEVRRHPPPYAIIAGGRPDQAAALECDGIHTYLHIPSPALLKMFLEGGTRRVIFEGRECGGHVGPRTSFVLWDQMIRVIVEQLDATGNKAEDYHVLFAGGVHDSTSASMVAAMAAPLSERGVRIGVLLGTAYLFTNEAVQAGAIVEGFQKAAVECQHTVLLESGVGHATRCADTEFGRFFNSEKRRLIREGKSKEEVREALESLNIGRLRVASKGITRNESTTSESSGGRYKQIDEKTQQRDGMYMIGQVAALRKEVCSIAALHEDVSAGGATKLARFAPSSTVHDRSNGESPSDVAIVGMSCMFPKANDLREFWENVLNRVNAISEIPSDRWDADLYFNGDRRAKDKIYSRWGGFLSDRPIDPTRFGMPPSAIPSIEPLQLLVLESVRQAIEDSGYHKRTFNRERTSVILGAGGGVADLGLGYGFRALLPYFLTKAGGSVEDAAELIEKLAGLLPEWTEDSFAGLLMNVAAGRVANRFDFGGTNYTVDAACASSLAAVRLAVTELESGSSDMVVVGGADTMQSPFAYLCFSKTQALSPTGQCRTFDETADGIVISEGIAMAVLKRLADAERDGDRIYAVIKGVGSSSDGKDKGLTAPRPAGQMRALDRAYAKAGFSPTTVGLIEAHGTGTVAGDQSEVESLTKTFTAAGAKSSSCALGSVKSLIGHTKCTAGVAGMLKAALALHHKTLPPTIGVTKPNSKANFGQSPFYINTESRPWISRLDGTPRRAGVSAFGFGGTNFHAVLEEYQGEDAIAASTSVESWPAELFLWKASSSSQITKSIDQVLSALDQGAKPLLRDLAAAVCEAASSLSGNCCLALVAGSLEDLKTKLIAAKDAIAKGSADFRDPRGVFFSTESTNEKGKIAFLFPGQGSQSVNMLRDLAIAMPAVREQFECANMALGDSLGRSLSEFVFPHPKFTNEEKAADEAALTQTRVAQPALGAADLSMLRVIRELGVKADMMAGHSYGEYVALCAAGVFSEADLIRISEARGRLIAEAGAANPGTMAAIDADEKTVVPAISGLNGVSIANLNSPMQTVISGSEQGVDAAIARLARQGVQGRRIKVSCAFHSPMVASALTPFRSALERMSVASPRGVVYSNTTAMPHTDDPNRIRESLVAHLVRPVRFADELVAMHDAGARIFIEVGPGRILTGLAERTLAGRPFRAVHLDQSGRNGLLQLVTALGQIAVAGVQFDVVRLFEGRVTRNLDLNKLVEQTSPKPHSATTWLVNGAKAVPVNESLKVQRSVAPAASKPIRPLSNQNGVAGKMPEVVVPTPPPQKAVAILSDQDKATKDGNGNGIASAAHAIERKPAMNREINAAPRPAGAESVLGSYHALMAKFLDTQRNVMLAYLQNAPQGQSIPASIQQQDPTLRPQFDVELRREISNGSTDIAMEQPVSHPPRASVSIHAHGEPTADVNGASVSTGPAIVIAPTNGSSLMSPVPAPSVPTREVLTSRLIAIVAERTGYPTDMLNPDLDLEADLGIDSIKRIEILGTLQNDGSLPGGSVDGEMETLSKLKTLRAIVDWLADRGTAAPSTKAPATPAIESRSAPAGATLEAPPSLEVKQIPRMTLDVIPAPIHGRSMPLKNNGVVLITDDEQGVASALAGVLGASGIPAVVVACARDGSQNGKYPRIDLTDPGAVKEFATRIQSHEGQIQALVHLMPLCDTRRANGDSPSQRAENDALGFFNLLQACEADLRTQKGRVLTATRMGGAFGQGNFSGDQIHPDQGAVCGIAKTVAREWSDVTSRVVDFEFAAGIEQIAANLNIELGVSDGPSEVGYRGGERVMLHPQVSSLSPKSLTGSSTLTRDSVVVITGGARGITAEIALELAQRFQPKLMLVGRSTLPGTESAATTGLTVARELKDALRKQLTSLGGTPTPASIESAYSRLLQDREILANFVAIREAGSIVEYHAVDVSDATRFGECLDAIYAKHEKIDGVIHGAGVTEDKLIRDKSIESFRRVMRPKVIGAYMLAEKLRPESLKFMFFFSSV
ncbi:MAG: acyltransferase domain-containing protein, partial [Planctomycetes bacterium]|nr:acyltransferase domain-containing protein [Planctomycetota bacterium]